MAAALPGIKPVFQAEERVGTKGKDKQVIYIW